MILISANNINLKPHTWEERPLTAPEMSLEPLVSLFSSSLFLCHEIEWTPGQGILSLSLTTFLKFSNNHWSLYPFFRWEIFLMPLCPNNPSLKRFGPYLHIMCYNTDKLLMGCLGGYLVTICTSQGLYQVVHILLITKWSFPNYNSQNKKKRRLSCELARRIAALKKSLCGVGVLSILE